jgi:cell division protease FtsH
VIARGTPGFSGADLANLVNEAALFAARANKRLVGMDEFEKAKDKIMMGAERRSMVMSEDEKRKLTAYHEAGHAIVGRLVPEHDPVYKVSIIPRGRALGVTMFLPEEDRYSYSKQHWRARSPACSAADRRGDDLRRGRSPPARRTTSARDRDRPQHGHQVGPVGEARAADLQRGRARRCSSAARSQQHKAVSDETAQLIDKEVRKHHRPQLRARQDILEDNMDKLHAMADALIKYETIDAEQIDDIMEGFWQEPGAQPAAAGALTELAVARVFPAGRLIAQVPDC